MTQGEGEGKRKVRTEDVRVIPVVQEEVTVGKRMVETGITRVTKKVREREEVISEPLRHEKVRVSRVPINRYVEKPLPVRQEGGTIIVPILEEVLVVEKRLLLKEELHISKESKVVHEPRRVTLRGEEAIVEHVGPAGQAERPGQGKER